MVHPQKNAFQPLIVRIVLPVICIITLIQIFHCSSKGNTAAPLTYGVISGSVKTSADSAAVSQANIVVYDANTNAPVTRVFSDVNGAFSVTVRPGVYYLKIAAQLYLPSPPPDGAPVSFEVVSNDTMVRKIFLDKDASAVSVGSVSGTVKVTGAGDLGGALVIAMRTTDSLAVSGVSGPDGFFILYNVPPGDYVLSCYRAGYLQDTARVSAIIVANAALQNAAIPMLARASGTLTGKITFLASNNSIVDVTLVHPLTREAMPGLSTKNTAGLDYRLEGIPSGTYIAWASYRNDGYVMDPDWIRKFGLPEVTFTASDTLKTLPFSVTGAIDSIRPSNPPDSVYAVAIHTTRPVFHWAKYSSAKEYIVEVFTSRGDRIWGGYDANGTVRHSQIDAHQDSVMFNFDQTAIDTLHFGQSYRWKVYADNDATPGVQGLISSSEDLLGLFMVVADTTK